MRMKRRSTTIRFSVLAVRVQSGEMQFRIDDRSSHFYNFTPLLPRYLSPLSRLFLSRYPSLAFSVAIATLSSRLSLSRFLHLSRARKCIHPARTLLPRGTSFNQNDASHTREACAYACTHVSPSFIRHRPTMIVLPLSRELAKRETRLHATSKRNLFLYDV